MRAANDMPGFRRAPGRGRVILVMVAAVVFLVVISLHQIAEFWTDYLWFDSVELSSVWSRTLNTKVGLALFFTLVFFVVMWANLLIADRVAPPFRPMGAEDELLTRYHQIIDHRAGGLRVLVALVFAFVIGLGMSSQWKEWLLFNNSRDFNQVDPEFGLDVGFYVFKLPFLTTVVDWAFASLVIVLLVTALAHYLNGGIRLQAPVDRVGSSVKAHLSVLLAALALVKAVDYYLQRYSILFSSRGTVDGATYTEVNAQKPAVTLLVLIALAAFALFIVNIRRRGWVLPVVAVGLWVFVQLIVGGAYPAVFQRFIVQPEESNKEASAIHNNILATRDAYGLAKVAPHAFEFSPSADEATKAINENPEITRNVQLLDPKRVLETFQRKQSLQSPLQFNRVSTDRYPMRMPDGSMQETQVVLANREIDGANIPQKSWQGEKLTYTHGYGLALAASNAVDQEGAPAFAVQGIPMASTNEIDLTNPEPDTYYFGAPVNAAVKSTLPGYSVVNTSSPEFDYVRNKADKRYTGTGGVPIDSFLRRAAFYLRFGDLDLMISQYLNPESKILYKREIRDRAAAVAPFLAFDSNPYPAVVDGRTVYILDAYTTTDRFPNSEHYPNQQLLDSPVLSLRSLNYVRNSVKVVVDTYDGSLSLYVVDQTDPIIAAYEAAFPELFTSKDKMSSELKAHVRYPEDIFAVQSDMWGRYHIDDAQKFYNLEGAWEPPPPPAAVTVSGSNSNNGAGQAPVLQQQVQNQAQQNRSSSAAVADSRSKLKINGRMAAAYSVNKLQGDAQSNYVLMRPFQPYSQDDNKKQLTSVLVARNDGEDLGKIDQYRIPDNLNLDGPALASDKMLNNEALSSKITLLSTAGSSVELSDIVVVPIGKTIVYLRTVYVVANNTPLVKLVAVHANNNVFVDTTFRGALTQAFPNARPLTLEADRAPVTSIGVGGTTTPTTPATTTTTSPAPSGTAAPPGVGTGPTSSTTIAPGGDVAGLVAGAYQDLADADAALRSGDLARYGQKVKDAQGRLEAARGQLAAAPTTTVAAVQTPPA